MFDEIQSNIVYTSQMIDVMFVFTRCLPYFPYSKKG